MRRVRACLEAHPVVAAREDAIVIRAGEERVGRFVIGERGDVAVGEGVGDDRPLLAVTLGDDDALGSRDGESIREVGSGKSCRPIR
jgi:hypothetical protein